MKNSNIVFAFALSEDGVFSNNHFGDAENFVICHYDGKKIIDLESIPNKYKKADESTEHGSRSKGEGIISYLRESGVKVLVSKQFGKNIKIVSKHFVPVIIRDDSPAVVREILVDYINLLEETLGLAKERYQLFNINKGVLKQITIKD